MAETNDIEMLTIAEMASEMGVSVSLLRKKIDDGEIRTIQWGNERRIPRWFVKTWQEKQLNKIQDMAAELLSGSKVQRAQKRVKGKDSTIPVTSTDHRKCG